MTINSLGVTFGGIRNFPQGRGDYTAVLSNILDYTHGNHSWKFGGEFRRFNGNAFTQDDGGFGFATMADFAAGHITALPSGFTMAELSPSPQALVRPAYSLIPWDCLPKTATRSRLI